jgi:hypothetical protein
VTSIVELYTFEKLTARGQIRDMREDKEQQLQLQYGVQLLFCVYTSTGFNDIA